MFFAKLTTLLSVAVFASALVALETPRVVNDRALEVANVTARQLPSYMIGTQTGDGTFYYPGLGACGIFNTAIDNIAAVSHLLYDTFPGYAGTNPNSNPVCGRKVRATYGGRTVTVAITDRCEGCGLTDLDFSPAAFTALASDLNIGRIHGMTWVWV